MKRLAWLLFSIAVAVGIQTTAVPAQILDENHYKVYRFIEDFYFINDPLILTDQFDQLPVEGMTLDKFANPVMKTIPGQNPEPILHPERHHTWWRFTEPHPQRNLLIANQFGEFNWRVFDAHYLVAPALKNEMGLLPLANHYKAYEATGDPVGIPVILSDQFGTVETLVLHPVYWLNPVHKIHGNDEYPMVNPEIHLACYELDPHHGVGIEIRALDQFVQDQFPWILNITEDCWLCVPSLKLEVIPNQKSTWGKVKALYD